MLRRHLVLPLVLSIACNKTAESPAPTNPEVPSAEAGLTSDECEARGGMVVGDIGDGATARPGYTCPDSGQAPLARVVPEAGGPIAVEGAVCCPTRGRQPAPTSP